MTEIYLALIALCTTIITTIVAPWVNEKLKNEKLKNVLSTISEYVKAAEKLFGAGKGEEKLEYVVNLLRAKGVVVSSETEAMIEAAVYSLDKIKEKIELPKV